MSAVELDENFVGDNFIKVWENQLRRLSSKIVESGNRKIPGLLLQIEKLLESINPVSKEAITIRKLLWKYKFVQTIIIFLKRDYTMIDGGWGTAAKLSLLLSKICVRVDFAESLEFQEESLPKAINNLLSLALQINQESSQIPVLDNTQQLREDFCEYFKMVLDSLNVLSSAYIFLPKMILKNDLLLKLLMTDDSQMGREIIQFIQNLARLDWKVLSELEEATLHTIFDELIYKLSVYTDPKVGQAASCCVLGFCENHAPLTDLLCTKYKGLRVILIKLAEKGYRSELKPLLSLLNAGSSQKAIKQKHYLAAQKIQAAWRGYVTRKRLRKLNKSIRKFQKLYLNWKEKERKKIYEEKQKVWQETQQRSELQQNLRIFHEKQLKKIEIMKADRIQNHFYQEMFSAAICIQKFWKGYKERSKWKERQLQLKQRKAAITIQRNVRKWLKTRQKSQVCLNSLKKPLTEIRREELQNVIIKWKQEHQPRTDCVEHQKELLQKTNQMLHQYYMKLPTSKKFLQHHQALKARIQIDSDLMLNCPKLQTVTKKDIEFYSSVSLPVALRAKEEHKNQLRKPGRYWWQNFEEEFEEGA